MAQLKVHGQPPVSEALSNPVRKGEFPALDGVRGIAALVVVVAHAANKGLLTPLLGSGYGQQGVILFFTLSGFLMAYLYGDRPFTWTEIVNYGLRRVGRVAPLFFAVVLASWLLWPHVRRDIWLFPINDAATLWSHLFFAKGAGALWTVPVEMQFYIVFLGIWFAAAQHRLMLALVVIEGVAVVSGVAFDARGSDVETLPYWIHFFLAGVAIGFLWRRQPAMVRALASSRHASKVAWLTFFAAALSMPMLRRAVGLHVFANWLDPVTAGLPVLFFLAAVASIGPFRVLAAGPLRSLGAISYGVYIFHYPILMTLIATIAPQGTSGKLLVFGFLCVLTVLVAHFSHEWFERPAQRMIVAWGRRKWAPREAGGN